MAGAVGRGGGHSVDGQSQEEQDVEEEHDEIDIAAEPVPLVPDQKRSFILHPIPF